MKTTAIVLSSTLSLGLFAMPVAAQDGAVDEPVETCLRITSAAPIEGLAPAALGQMLLDGGVTMEVLGPEACGAEVDRPEVDGQKPAREARTTPYVQFVAHGAGAAIELAALAERNRDAQSLSDLDRAARQLSAWAKSKRKWLDRHPPEPCYASVHKHWRRGVVDARAGAKAVRRSVRTLQPEPMRRGVRKLAASAKRLTSVDLERANRACAADSSS